MAMGIAARERLGEDPAIAQSDSGGTGASLQSMTVGDITVTAGNFRTQAGRFMADVCFNMRTAQERTIHEASLRYGSHLISGHGYGAEMIEMTRPSGDQPGKRCDILYFDIGREAEIKDFTLTIDVIAAAPYKGEPCEPEYLAMYQKALDERNSGITVDCVRDLPFVTGLRVVDKPAAMTMEGAQAIVGSRSSLTTCAAEGGHGCSRAARTRRG